jgi:hypothetical protein
MQRQRRLVTDAQAAAWMDALTRASAAGEFYRSVTCYAVLLTPL